jgi:hypothetical protein
LVVPDAIGAGAGFDEGLSVLASVGDPRQTLVISTADDPPGSPAGGRRLDTRAVRWSRPSPELFELSGVNPYAHAYLLVNESYFDGWSATLDGVPTELLQVNGRFMAIALGPGGFKATLRYRSTYLAAGAWISIAGLIVCVWLLVGSPLPRRRFRPIPVHAS